MGTRDAAEPGRRFRLTRGIETTDNLGRRKHHEEAVRSLGDRGDRGVWRDPDAAERSGEPGPGDCGEGSHPGVPVDGVPVDGRPDDPGGPVDRGPRADDHVDRGSREEVIAGS